MSALDIFRIVEAFDPAKHPRNPKGAPGGGKFRSLSARVADAIHGGEEGVLEKLSRPQLRTVAKAHGIETRGKPDRVLRGEIHSKIRAEGPSPAAGPEDDEDESDGRAATEKAAAERAKLEKSLIRRYVAGESIQELASSEGRSSSFVHSILTKSGVQLRQRGGMTRGDRAKATARKAAAPKAAPASKAEPESWGQTRYDGPTPTEKRYLDALTSGNRQAAIRARADDYRERHDGRTPDMAEIEQAVDRDIARRERRRVSGFDFARESVALRVFRIVEAAGRDTHPGGEELRRYWTQDPEGLAKWVGHPHEWTTLYHHLAKHMPPEMAKRVAADWFHRVKGFWPGSDLHRVEHGKPPRGDRIGPG